MFRHCEAPGFLPLADTNILLAASGLDGFSTFLFRTFSVRQTIEIRRDRKPNRNVSQVAIQVGVPTGNKAARRAYGMVIKHLLPSASDCCAVHTASRLVHQFSAVQSVPVHVHSESTGHVTVTVQAELFSQCLCGEQISCVCTLIIKLQISDTHSIICFIT